MQNSLDKKKWVAKYAYSEIIFALLQKKRMKVTLKLYKRLMFASLATQLEFAQILT